MARSRFIRGLAGGAVLALAAGGVVGTAGPAAADAPVQHVVLVSVDGLHAGDLARYVAAHPSSALAALTRTGTTYTAARTASLSDSFPGLLGIVAGGTPRSTGVYYDDSYDRTYYPAGSTCSGAAGTEALYDSSLDRLDGNGKIPLDTTLDPATFPRDAGCAPVQPSDFVATNTIFSVLHAAGRRTAWIDKHPAYQIVAGRGTPSAVDDLYTPEIDAEVLPSSHSDLRGGTVSFDTGKSVTGWVPNVEAYDTLHVGALLNELDGKRSDGTGTPGVPVLLGMNLQSVSVGQKLVDPVKSCARNTAGGCDPSYVPGGYQADGSPTPQLAGTLDFVDAQLRRVVAEIAGQGLASSTEIILTAKHGQSPVDPSTLQKPGDVITPVVGADSIAQQTADDVSLLWLTPGTDAGSKAAALRSSSSSDKCATVYAGAGLTNAFGPRTAGSLQAARQPDIICQPVPGVIYTTSKAKVTEHGGIAEDDTHVALLLSRAGALASTVAAGVTTAQVAPTILRDLAVYDGNDTTRSPLDAVRAEDTQPLPGATLGTSLPEVPVAALLPVAGLLAAGGVVRLWRRRRLAG